MGHAQHKIFTNNSTFALDVIADRARIISFRLNMNYCGVSLFLTSDELARGDLDVDLP
jgi:hypothetical protein